MALPPQTVSVAQFTSVEAEFLREFADLPFQEGDVLYIDASLKVQRLGIGSTGEVLTVSAGGIPEWDAGASSGGTVQTISIASANGFAGTSDADPTDPELTLSTSITGILQGDGTSLSAITVGSGLDFTGGTLSATSTATIGGSIATGQVAFGTGTDTIGGSNNLFWNNTDGRLGIGTSSPSERLVVSGTGAQRILINASVNGPAAIVQTTIVGSFGWYASGTNDLFMLRNYNTSTDIVTVSGSGNVGIGTTAPTHTITLANTATGTALYNTSDQTTNYERVVSAWGSNVYKILPQAGGTGTVRAIQIGQDSGNLSVANTGITTITNTTNQASNQVLVIQGDRSSPATNDEIYQSFVMSDSAGNQDEFARISALISDVTSGAEFGRLRFSVAVSGSISSRMELISSALRPASDGLINIGTTANGFGGVFLSSGATLNFANGNSVITHSSGVLTVSTGDLRVTTAGTNSASVLTQASTNTVSNKDVSGTSNTLISRTTDTSTATPTPTGGSDINHYSLTALATAATFAAPSGTPKEGNRLTIRITPDATPRALDWNAIYAPSSQVELPTTTIASKWMELGFLYNATAALWVLVARADQV